MHDELGIFVVIQPGAAQLLVRQIKAQRLDQMQTAAGIGRKPDHIAGIRRDFRFNQDNFKHMT
jgi:hypothetical protein